MNGKGDGRRPTLVDEATLESNWARTFGKEEPEQFPRCLNCGATWYYSEPGPNCDVCASPLTPS